MATPSSSSTFSPSSASSMTTMMRKDDEQSDLKLSAHLMELLGSGNRDAGATPSSSSTSSSTGAVCTTPKSRKSAGRRTAAPVPRRNLFVATAAPAVSQQSDQDGPSKRSSSVVSPSLALMQALCVTPKSSTTSARSTSNTPRVFYGQRHAASTGCMSALSSPAVLGQRVSVQELFGASTSVNANNASPKSRYDADGEIAALTAAVNALPKSPSRVGQQPAMFSTPTTHHHGQQQQQQHRQNLRRQQSASATLTGGRNGAGGGLRTAASTAAFCAAISSFRRFTPPPGKEISSPIFAASKYAESPSARSLPLPPDDWIQEALSLQHAVIVEDALEDDHAEPAARPSFFLDIGTGSTTTTTAADSDGESTEEEDALSTASSGVVFDLDEAAEDPSKPTVALIRPLLPMASAGGESSAADSGEGSMTSASDNECDSVIESAGIRMNPFSLIAAVVASAPVTPVM